MTKVAFMFPGQGAQYQFMGRKLFETEPVFRGALERCARIIDPLLQTSLLSVINSEDPEILQQTRFAQPALFALAAAVPVATPEPFTAAVAIIALKEAVSAAGTDANSDDARIPRVLARITVVHQL